jgi:histone H4
MARRGGVKRISRDVYPLSREFMKMYVSEILNDAMIYANYAERHTLIADDIVRAAKRHG